MWEWICLGLGVAAPVIWIALRVRLSRRLLAEEHFLEVARGVLRLKAAALERVIVTEEDNVRWGEDPRTLVTSSRLAVIYTLHKTEEQEQFVHHYSMSVAGGYMAHAVGERLVLFVAKLLGVPFEKLALLVVVRSMVYHAEFILSEAEQAEFVSRSVSELSVAEVNAFLREFLEASKHLQWQRWDVGLPNAALQPPAHKPRRG
jgi:hypothetical protein